MVVAKKPIFGQKTSPYQKTSGTYAPQKSTNPGGFLKATGLKKLTDLGQGSIFKPVSGSLANSGKSALDPDTHKWTYYGDDSQYNVPAEQPWPTYNPTNNNNNSGGGGGGGGGGAAPIDMGSIMALLNGRQPQQYNWQDYQWQDVDLPEYQAREFYNFDTSQYDQARTGITQGLAADQATGDTAYADATTELNQYVNPFANRAYTQNQPMDQAMQRMMAANGAQADQATTNQGVQADQAFGNVLALMGGAAANNQASSLRALGGDQRRFTESLQNQGRNMNLSVNMAQARAQEQYNKDKWQYGEEVARLNYQTNMQEAQYNNQGRNQVGQSNNQGQNQANQGNAQMANDWWTNNSKTLIDLIAGGGQIDPALLQQFISGGAPAAPAA